MLPLRCSGQHRAPWPPSSCARILHPSSRPVAGMTFNELGSARLSTAFAAFRPVAFASRFPTLIEAFTTLLSIAQRRCRPAASSVCTLPLSLRVGENPLAANQPAPGSYSAAPVRLLARAFRLSAVDFPRGVSRFPSSDFQPHGSQGHVGQGDHFWHRHLPYAQVCILPLLIRPAEQPDRLPSIVRHPNRARRSRVNPGGFAEASPTVLWASNQATPGFDSTYRCLRNAW